MNIDVLTLPEIRDVYDQQLKYDFPANERKPLSMIEKSLKNQRYLCYGLRNDDEILAYAFFVVFDDLYLVDYFAVRKELRGTGIGSRFLKESGNLLIQNASCVLLEVEDPTAGKSNDEREIRNRRLRFYLKNGLRDTEARFRTFDVDFMILEFQIGEAHNQETAGEIYSRIYRSFLPKKVFARMVKTLK